MAKLKARGRSEAFRVVEEMPDTENTTENRVHFALMSDGRLLRKNSCRFRATEYRGPYAHTWGWKLWKKIKDDAPQGAGRRMLDALLKAGAKLDGTPDFNLVDSL